MRKLAIGLLSFVMLTSVYAQQPYQTAKIVTPNTTKMVRIPLVKLDAKAKRSLRSRALGLADAAKQKPMQAKLDSDLNLTMGGVPILDQGAHGACATFAVTAAYDAMLYGDDAISQLCLLQLGKTLHQQDRKVFSGWEGAMFEDVFDRIDKYGFIDKKSETDIRCGGLLEYPKYSADTGHAMSIERYQSFSHKPDSNIKIRTIKQDSGNQLVENIKEELELGNRVIVGLLVDPQSYNVGFIENHNTYFYGDTLAITDSLIIRILNEQFDTLGGHAMIIYGYDDSAKHRGQKGVFFLRNSWGKSWGYYGDGYVTYDYLKLMIMDAYALAKPNK